MFYIRTTYGDIAILSATQFPQPQSLDAIWTRQRCLQIHPWNDAEEGKFFDRMGRSTWQLVSTVAVIIFIRSHLMHKSLLDCTTKNSIEARLLPLVLIRLRPLSR